MRILALTLVVRDESDILAANLDYHFAQGVDVILVVDHGSSDGTAEILRAYEQAGRLLQTIRRAIPDTGRLLIIDAVLPPGDEPHFGKLLDLTMMAMLTGRERSEAEFAALLDGAGFRLVEVSQMAAPTSLIEARPA